MKDRHRQKAPSNKTPALSESMNMDIWVVGTSNQLYKRFQNCNKIFKKLVTGKTRSILYSPFCVLTLASDMAVLYGNDAFSMLRHEK